MEPNKEDKKNDDLGLNQLVKKYDIDNTSTIKWKNISNSWRRVIKPSAKKIADYLNLRKK